MAKRGSTRNTSQRHGDEFQYMMMAARMFTGAFRIQRTGQEAFDIEAECDQAYGLATSVKTAKGDSIGLADAERFARIDRPWRMLFGPWVQEDERVKAIHVVHDMIVPLSVTRKLLGGLTPETVLDWHNDIASYASGRAAAAEARRRAAEIAAEMKALGSLLRLDAKIDDWDQRRVQFSVSFELLASLLATLPPYQAKGDLRRPHHVEYRGEFHQYPLPIRLISPARVIDREGRDVEEHDRTIMFEDAPVVMPAATLEDVLGGPVTGTALRRAVPVRREERDRQRQTQADTRQARLFG